MIAATLLALSAALCAAPVATASDRVTVFAAASLGGALEAVGAAFEQAGGARVRIVLAGTPALARQIESGAPADVFIAANPDWMTYLSDRGAIDAVGAVDLLSNRLVLIGGADAEADPAPGALTGAPFARWLDRRLGDGRLAMALVEAAPAGIYGRAALETLGLWEGVRGRVAETDNVRAALALVATGAAPLGVVYETDAAADPRVAIVARFPADAHPSIVYPAARLAGRDTAAAHAFFAYLQSAEAAALFERAGFIALGGDAR